MARNNALDFVKGAGVLAMAVHHSINYFPTGNLSTKYLHFVSGAFPFLAGFLVSNLLVKRPTLDGQKPNLGRRLIFRGLRLLILCAALNILLAVFLGRSAKFGRLPVGDFLEYVDMLYWSGTYIQVSFSLLVPIGYVLIVLGLLYYCKALTGPWLSIVACCLFAYCAAAELFPLAINYYTGYFEIGMIGAALGCIATQKIDAFCKGWGWLWVSLIYVISLGAISYWGLGFIVFAFYVTATLLMLYLIG